CSIERIPMRRHFSDFQADNITSPKLAVYGEVKQREIPSTVRQLKARSHRPDMLWTQRWSCSIDLAFVPRPTNLFMCLDKLVHDCFSFCLKEKPMRPIRLRGGSAFGIEADKSDGSPWRPLMTLS